MKKDNVLYVVLGVLVFGMMLMLIFFFSNKNIDWSENYWQNEQPYDIDILIELLEEENDRFSKITEDPLDFLETLEDTVPSSYIFFYNERMILDSLRIEKLIAYADQGNDVFFITKTLPPSLIEKYFVDTFSDSFWEKNHLYSRRDSTISVGLTEDKENESYKFDYMFRYGPAYKDWFYLDSLFLCDLGAQAELLGYIDNDQVNFFKIKQGEGNIFVHSNPVCFTNYSLLNRDAFVYSNKVFSNVKTEKIYWSDWNYFYTNNTNRPNPSLINESPLRVFLEETPFKWAWYFLLVMFLLFIIFRAKRERPPVPVIEKNTNTSIEYVEAIVNLYFNKKEHHTVLHQLMDQWHLYIRKRYGVNERLYADKEDYVKAVVSHSGISEEELAPIIEYYNKDYHLKAVVSFEELVRFYSLTENFYKKSK